MRRLIRRARVVSAATLLSMAACTSSSGHRAATGSTTAANGVATTAAAPCKSVPASGPQPSWMPPDLPLPNGTFAADQQPPSTATAHRGLFVVPGTLPDFVHLVLTTWPSKGWILGRGDAEAGEQEGGFGRGTSGGSWRVRTSYCDPHHVELLLVYAEVLNSNLTTTTAAPTAP